MAWPLLVAVAFVCMCGVGTVADAAELPCEVHGVQPQAEKSLFHGLPSEMIVEILKYLEDDIEGYTAFFLAFPDLVTMRIPALEEDFLNKAAEEMSTFEWWIGLKSQIQRQLKPVTDLYIIRAQLSRTFSDSDPLDELQDAAREIAGQYDDCISRTQLMKLNQSAWKDNCNKLFLSEHFSCTIWPLLPPEFREKQRMTALKEASNRNDIVALVCILDADKYDQPAIQKLISTSVMPEYRGLFRVILERRLTLQTGGYTAENILGDAFLAVCNAGNLDFLRELLKLNEAGNALFYGAFGPDSLLLRGLKIALTNKHRTIVRHLLLLRGNPIYEPLNVFRCAIAEGDKGTVGALLNFRDKEGPLDIIVSDDEMRAAALGEPYSETRKLLLLLLLETLGRERLVDYIEDYLRDASSMRGLVMARLGAPDMLRIAKGHLGHKKVKFMVFNRQ